MKLFGKNFTFLLALTGIKQNVVAKYLAVDNSTIWKWKHGTIPQNAEMIIKIAKYFSEKCNIPYPLFENGQALLTKDMSQILDSQERNLQVKQLPVSYSPESIPMDENSTGLDDYEPHELQLIDFFRKLKHGSRTIKLSQNTTIRIQEAMEIIGVDDKGHYALLEFANRIRRYYGGQAEKGGDEREKE